MADPMRIRAKIEGDHCVVRVLMSHDMETGLRKDASGKLVPARFIHRVTADLNGRPVFSALWGPSVSKNPVLQFSFTGAHPGDKVRITWVDTDGDNRTDEAVVAG
jgi:sulfur-oxidizing protein SoxZ